MEPQKINRDMIKERLLSLQKKKFLTDIKGIKQEIIHLEERYRNFLTKYESNNLFDLKPKVPPDIYDKAEEMKKTIEKKNIDLAYTQEQGRKVKRGLRSMSQKMFPEHHEEQAEGTA